MNLIRKNQLYRRLLSANFISALGDSLYYIALLTYAQQFENSSLTILLVSCSETLPNLFYVITGGLADRTTKKAQKIIQLSIFRALLYGCVGLLIGLQQTLLILVRIVFLNFVSDIYGKYTSGLLSPFLLPAVGKDQIAEASGLTKSIITFITIIAQFIGASLIALLSYQAFAWLNSLTFLLNGLVIFSIYTVLQTIESKDLSVTAEPFTLQGFSSQLAIAFKFLYSRRTLFLLLLQFTLLNGLLSSQLPLFSMWLALHKEQAVVNFSFTIAFFTASSSCGIILGNLTSAAFFKSWRISQLLPPIFSLMGLYFIGLFMNQLILSLLISFVITYLIGGVQPKLSAKMYLEIPLEQFATINGVSNTLLTVASPLVALLFSTIAATASVSSALFLISLLALAAVGISSYLKHEN